MVCIWAVQYITIDWKLSLLKIISTTVLVFTFFSVAHWQKCTVMWFYCFLPYTALLIMAIFVLIMFMIIVLPLMLQWIQCTNKQAENQLNNKRMKKIIYILYADSYIGLSFVVIHFAGCERGRMCVCVWGSVCIVSNIYPYPNPRQCFFSAASRTCLNEIGRTRMVTRHPQARHQIFASIPKQELPLTLMLEWHWSPSPLQTPNTDNVFQLWCPIVDNDNWLPSAPMSFPFVPNIASLILLFFPEKNEFYLIFFSLAHLIVSL